MPEGCVGGTSKEDEVLRKGFRLCDVQMGSKPILQSRQTSQSARGVLFLIVTVSDTIEVLLEGVVNVRALPFIHIDTMAGSHGTFASSAYMYPLYLSGFGGGLSTYRG